jgi:hypothetical protein
MAYLLVRGESVNLDVAALNGANQHIPALPNNGIPTWTTSHPTKTTLIPSPDGNTCLVKGVGLQVGVTITATAGILTVPFALDVVTELPVSVVIFPNPPVQNPGNIDQRQLSAGGRYLGVGFNSPPNS